MAKAELHGYVERVPRSMQAEQETVISAEMLTRMGVPRNSNCLFWAVAMAYSLPVKNNYSLFEDRAIEIFSGEYLQSFTRCFQSQILDKCTFQSVYQNQFFAELVIDVFRTRVAMEMEWDAELCRDRISLEDIFNMKNEDFFTNGSFAKRFKKAFPTATHLVDLQKLKPEELNSDAIHAINEELKKITNKKKLLDFLFDSYTESLTNRKSWGGQLVIRAMERRLKCRICVFNIGKSIFEINSKDVNIFLFKTDENCYDFGLRKVQIVMQALKEKNYRKAVDYINVGVDDIHFQDENKNSLLHLAIFSDNQEEIISRLIWQGASLHKKNRNRQTPLDLAKDLKMKNSIACLKMHAKELKKHKWCCIS